jgi:aspartate aminotransferase
VSQYAAVAALNGSQQCVLDMLVEFRKRRNYVLGRLQQIPNIRFADPSGAFYAFFDVSAYFGKPLGANGKKVTNSSDFCTALLEDAHVALVTGDAFGAPGYVRLSFATSLEILEAGIDRIAKFLNP